MTGLGPSGIDDALDAIEQERARKADLDAWCAAGHHYFVRRENVWACRHCTEPAPAQPGVRDAS